MNGGGIKPSLTTPRLRAITSRTRRHIRPGRARVKHLLLLFALLDFALILVACGEAPQEGRTGSDGDVGERVSTAEGSYTRVPPAELDAMLEDGDDVVLVNTHVPFEGDIPGTDLSVPYDEVGQNLDRLPEDRGTRIAVYCEGGPMSAAAAENLVALGYEDVWDLEGGMNAWRRAGLPLEGV